MALPFRPRLARAHGATPPCEPGSSRNRRQRGVSDVRRPIVLGYPAPPRCLRVAAISPGSEPTLPELGTNNRRGGGDRLPRPQETALANGWEDRMPSLLNEALEWLDRAEQAREVAGQLTDPSARKAVLELAESFDRLARAAATPAVLRRRELARKDRERNW